MAQQVDIGVICLNDWMPNYEEKRNRITSFKAAFLYQPSKDGKSDYWEYGYAPVGAAFFILGFPLGLALRGLSRFGSVAPALRSLWSIAGQMPIFFGFGHASRDVWLASGALRHSTDQFSRLTCSFAASICRTMADWRICGPPRLLPRGTGDVTREGLLAGWKKSLSAAKVPRSGGPCSCSGGPPRYSGSRGSPSRLLVLSERELLDITSRLREQDEGAFLSLNTDLSRIDHPVAGT
ncbi:hypothetical protein [Bradyrhizobium sp. CCBAU 45384]|uniref:hypothetical protein n=1 Tax=Bradyrhizobium sp. CCBAU 45384 TaxID=858428 RepID=UPI002306A0AA|nr:hypothetical protein [Bradyrhizobium sp. CCBAU 45384]